jgi:signal peptidase I
MQQSPKNLSKRRTRYLVNALSITILILLVGGMRFSQVQSQTMIPTLAVGDTLIGFFPLISPAPGHVVTFTSQAGCCQVSRVVGVEGDDVRIVDDQLFVNGVPEISEPASDLFADVRSDVPAFVGFLSAELAGNERLLARSAPRFRNLTGPLASDISVKVPEGKVFILNDWRDSGPDSRVLGSISTGSIHSIVVGRLWAAEDGQPLAITSLSPRALF